MAEDLRKSPLNERAMRLEIERCRSEIAGIEAQLRSGHPDLQGLLLALSDWHAELRFIEQDTLTVLEGVSFEHSRYTEYSAPREGRRMSKGSILKLLEDKRAWTAQPVALPGQLHSSSGCLLSRTNQQPPCDKNAGQRSS
jgi:hypothetical protein